jgi:hypothetical protein
LDELDEPLMSSEVVKIRNKIKPVTILFIPLLSPQPYFR